MNFQQLEYIIAVDKKKHFGLASEYCNITQATLSAMIKKLEVELDVILFDRSKKPVKTTEKGDEVIEFAKRILKERNELIRIGQVETDELMGELRIGVIPTVANSLLALILPTLLVDFPKLKLKVFEITTEQIKDQLISEKIDLGILATPIDNDLLEENILYYESMMVYGLEGEAKKYSAPEDLYNKKVWMLEEGNCFRTQTSTVCNLKEHSVQEENLEFEANSFDTLINLIDKFGGVTLIPELYYNLMSEDKKVRASHFELPIPVREISIVYHRPYAKKKSIDILSKLIQAMIAPLLVTKDYKPKDMNIIGI